MIECPKGSLYSVLFGAIIALASAFVVTTLYQHVMAGATNQTTASEDMTGVEFLSIQNARSGSLSQINATAYTLELNNVANETIQFSDRPERVVETISTADFIGNWTAGQNSFAADAPNDALIVENTQSSQLETAVIESFNPVYDMATNTLTYTIMAENGTSIGLPDEFGQAVLVIDIDPCEIE